MKINISFRRLGNSRIKYKMWQNNINTLQMYETPWRLGWGQVLTKVTIKMSGTLSFWFGLFFSKIFAYKMEKAIAPHSCTLAWKIPWTGAPGRLRSMGSRTVGQDWATSLSLFTFMHWRRKWQPTPVFLPGESLGWGSLVGCRLWGHTESDTTEVT